MTTNSSKSSEVRSIIFMCPKVGGSKDPGKTTLNIGVSINKIGTRVKRQIVNCQIMNLTLREQRGKIYYMKKIAFVRTFILIALFLPAFSCKTAPVEEAPIEEAAVAVEAAPVNVPAAEEPVPPAVQAEDPSFDPGNVSQEVYDVTLNEVKKAIVELNRICTDAGKSASADRSYNEWLTWVTGDYATHTSDPAYLALLSQQPALTSRNKKLESQKDYFINVFAASRQNVKVDGIEFITPRRVKVWGLQEEQRSAPASRELQQAMLDQGYELVKIGNQNRMVRTNKIRYYVLEKEDKWKIASLDDE
jgi:hypothetical protein